MSKPQSEVPAEKGGEKQQPSKGSGLIINIVTTTLICSIFLGLCYKVMSDMSKQLQKNLAGEEEADTGIEEVTKGYIMDLGEFTMNLADASHKAYLKTAVVMEVSMTDKDTVPQAAAEGGHGSKPAQPSIEDELERYKPAIRDAIITVLSAKTTDELATTTGKELAKEQITEQVNAIFGGEREVLRISFGQFIMQQGR